MLTQRELHFSCSQFTSGESRRTANQLLTGRELWSYHLSSILLIQSPKWSRKTGDRQVLAGKQNDTAFLYLSWQCGITSVHSSKEQLSYDSLLNTHTHSYTNGRNTVLKKNPGRTVTEEIISGRSSPSIPTGNHLCVSALQIILVLKVFMLSRVDWSELLRTEQVTAKATCMTLLMD